MKELRSLEDLLDLQVVDLEIDRLLDRRHTMPLLDRYRAAHEEQVRISGEAAALSAQMRETALALDKAEGELALHQEKREMEERRLYAGGFGAREAEHLRQEVEMLARQAGEAEDEILELMERREQQEQALAGLESERESAVAAENELEAEVAAEWKVIDAEIARKESRKAEIVPLIPSDLLELYEELRPAKEGIAVGRFAEGVCGGCHLRLSAAEQVEVRKEHPPRCLRCMRILVPQ